MLNQIIQSQLTLHPEKSLPMQGDSFEEAAQYAGWIYPIRYLLALRYLKVKQKTLEWFRQNKIYPVPEADFRQALLQQLSKAKNKQRFNTKQDSEQAPKKSPISAFGFKTGVFYPLLLAGILFGAWSLNNWYQERKIENIFANHLPFYSDLIHRKLLLRYDGSETALKVIDQEISEERENILVDLPTKGGIRTLVAEQLDQLKDSSLSVRDILMGFKKVNIALDKQRIPFYLSPKSFRLPCSSFIDAPVEQMMMIKKMESLMSDNKPEYCRTTIMTTYKIKQRKQLYYTDTSGKKAEVELPLFLSTRVDRVPAVDSALGLTYRETGIGSLILLDRIKRFTTESVLPALTFQGRSYVIPYWMQGYYDIEESITKSYKKDLKKVYYDDAELRKVKTAVKQLLKDKRRLSNSKMQQTLQRNNAGNSDSVFGSGLDAISVLMGKKAKTKLAKKIEPVEIPSLDKLNDVLLPSIEYHEAYHQIIKDDWQVPDWQKTVFKDLDENMIDHSMEELGAYLSQLANTRSGHNIWLSKLLIFSLNPMTKGQAEYYASGMILTTMKAIADGKPIKPHFDATVDEKTEMYKALAVLDSRYIREYARIAYENLFQRDTPVLNDTH